MSGVRVRVATTPRNEAGEGGGGETIKNAEPSEGQTPNKRAWMVECPA